jgi:CBS domain-containing protein
MGLKNFALSDHGGTKKEPSLVPPKTLSRIEILITIFLPVLPFNLFLLYSYNKLPIDHERRTAMQFSVRDWMMDLVVFIDPDSTVLEALAVMRRRYIHSLIVNKSSNNLDYGIVTSTDISDKIIAQDRNPAEMIVIQIMNSPLVTVKEDMSLRECARLMKQHNIHHLPVVDEEGIPIGMISDTDFLVAAEAMGRAPGEKII